MPIVPLYSEPQVAPSPAPAVRQNLQAPADAFGASIGQAGVNAGEAIYQAGMQANQLRTEAAVNQYQKALLDLGQGNGKDEPGAFNVKGMSVLPTPNADPSSDEAKPLTDRYMSKAQIQANQIRASLANDAQRAMFDQASGRLNLAFGGQLREHETAQSNRAMADTVSNGIDLSTQAAASAVQNGDLDAAETQRQRAIALSRQFAVLNGMDPDVAQQEATSQVGSAIVTAYLQGNNPKQAMAYFQDHKDDFTLKARESLGHVIQSRNEIQTAFTTANKIYDEAAAADPSGTPNLQTMTAKLRDIYKDDAEGYQKSVAIMKERLSDQVEASRQQDYAAEGTLWKGIVAGGSLHDAVNSQLFSNLTGEKQASFIKGVQAFQKREESADGGDSLEKFKNYWALKSNPQILSKMSDDQVLSMAPDLGASLVKKVLEDKQKLNQPGKMQSEAITQEKFNFWAKQGGLNPSTKNTDELGRLGSLRLQADELINAEVEAKGRKLTPPEMNDVMKRLVTDHVVQTTPGILWGTNTKEIPLYQAITPDDEAKVRKTLSDHGITHPTASQLMDAYEAYKK